MFWSHSNWSTVKTFSKNLSTYLSFTPSFILPQLYFLWTKESIFVTLRVTFCDLMRNFLWPKESLSLTWWVIFADQISLALWANESFKYCKNINNHGKSSNKPISFNKHPNEKILPPISTPLHVLNIF